MDGFDNLPEQDEAKRLLRSALSEGPAHAYLFHGAAGVGKRGAALAFAGELLGDAPRVERRIHPDLYLLEPVGDQIRIDDIRSLRRDLHMRPFEAERRVYLLFSAETMNEDAADALLKDLEEPPPYVVVVLVADEIGPLPETIRSRCQVVPFRRLSERAVRAAIDERAPGLSPNEVTALARVAAGRIDRAERLLDADAVGRRQRLLETARSVYLESDFDPGEAADTILRSMSERGSSVLYTRCPNPMRRSPRSIASRIHASALSMVPIESSMSSARLGAPPCSGPESAPMPPTTAAARSAPVDVITRAVKVDALKPWSTVVMRYCSTARAYSGFGTSPFIMKR